MAEAYALTEILGHLTRLGHALRLTIVCLVLAAMLGGVLVLGGSTIAQQVTALSNTLKSQIVNVKGFLEQHGVDTSFLDFGGTTPATGEAATPTVQRNPAGSGLPSAGAIASGGGAIVSQTLKLILGTVGAVGNFFIVLFLGLCFAAQPSVYRIGLLRMTPAQHRETQAEK